MRSSNEKEEKNKRIGWLTSVGIQLILLLLFYFIIAWREPFPPIPEYGIELGFTASSGAPAAASQVNQVIEEDVEQIVEDSQDSQEVIEEQPIQEEPVNESVTESDPVEPTEEQIEPVTQEVQDVSVEQEPVERESKEDVIEEAPAEKEEELIDGRAVMPSSSSESDGDTEQPSEGEEESEEVDERALYGSQGSTASSSEGASLSLAGWIWDFKPQPNDTSDQEGRITYKIVVDQDGLLVKIDLISSTVSPAVERKYRAAVQKLTFTKTGNDESAPLSSGTVTFIINSR